MILSEMGFKFKEEVIWNKRRVSSPVHPLARVHETISIHAKGNGSINKSIVNYGELKRFDLDKVYEDIKRLGGLFNKGAAFEKVVENLKQSELGDGYAHSTYLNKNHHTFQSDSHNRCISTYTIQAIEKGCREQSIINDADTHYNNIHPTQKPVRLIERLLALVVPDKQFDQVTVADFFGGSFSTMEAVYNMQMKGVSVEIDTEWYLSGRKRIEDLPVIQSKLF